MARTIEELDPLSAWDWDEEETSQKDANTRYICKTTDSVKHN